MQATNDFILTALIVICLNIWNAAYLLSTDEKRAIAFSWVASMVIFFGYIIFRIMKL